VYTIIKLIPKSNKSIDWSPLSLPRLLLQNKQLLRLHLYLRNNLILSAAPLLSELLVLRLLTIDQLLELFLEKEHFLLEVVDLRGEDDLAVGAKVIKEST
jgi:hypothetical protein